MADTINCYNENEPCERCNKSPVEFIHEGSLTQGKLTKLCKPCFAELCKSEGK